MGKVKILGLDLSMSCAGFAVIEIDNGKPVLIHTSHAKTNSKYSHGQRLIQIEQHLLKLIEEYGKFDYVVREKGFSQHAMTTQVIFRVVGVSDLTLAKQGYTEIVDISPTTVKKTIAGNGKASKEEVAEAVQKYIGAYKFKVNDESDACGIALSHVIQKKLIK